MDYSWKTKWSEVKSLSCVRLFATPWTVAYCAPPSVGFSRQEYWNGLPFPSSENLPVSGIKPRSSALQADCYHLSHQPFRIMLSLLFLCSLNGTARPDDSASAYNIDYWVFQVHCWDLMLRKRFLSKYSFSLTMHLVTQELWWRHPTRLMFSCLLT